MATFNWIESGTAFCTKPGQIVGSSAEPYAATQSGASSPDSGIEQEWDRLSRLERAICELLIVNEHLRRCLRLAGSAVPEETEAA